MKDNDKMIDLDDEQDFVILGDNSVALAKLPDASFQLIYIDPPFNTGSRQQRKTLQTVRDDAGDRTGFAGRRYSTMELGRLCYSDMHDDYLAFIAPRLEEARRLLTQDGTLYFHIDYREAHYCKVLLDEIFGRDCFLNEIIWAYDYGGRARDRWPAKHVTILVYVKEAKHHFFDQDTASNASPTWPPAWSLLRKQSVGSYRPTYGGILLFPLTEVRRRGIQTRSPKACFGAW